MLFSTSKKIPGVETYSTIAAALAALKEEEKIFVIGGGKIFEQFLDRADELHLTLVDIDVDGDTFFPSYEHLIGTRFMLVNEEKHEGYTFRDYISQIKFNKIFSSDSMKDILRSAAERAIHYLEGLDNRGVRPDPAAVARLKEFDIPFPEKPVEPSAILTNAR